MLASSDGSDDKDGTDILCEGNEGEAQTGGMHTPSREVCTSLTWSSVDDGGRKEVARGQ